MPLYSAIIHQHHEIANLLLANGAILDMHSDSFLGKIDVIRNYLEQNGDKDLRGYRNKTLLHMAAWNNQLEMAEFLISTNAQVNAQDQYYRTPLHFAASNPDANKLAELLIKHSAELNLVASKGLIGDGDGKDRTGTPLHIASRYNYTKIAELLINQGADVNASYRGNTPLHMLADSRTISSTDTAQLLIANGANINTHEKFQGKTPLHQAAYRGHTKIAELLLVNGANVNSRDFSGNTPFTSAIK